MSKSLAEIRDALENVVFDDVGGFDPRKDPERYIRFLHLAIEEMDQEIKRLRAHLDVFYEQEEIKYLMESR